MQHLSPVKAPWIEPDVQQVIDLTIYHQSVPTVWEEVIVLLIPALLYGLKHTLNKDNFRTALIAIP